MQESAVWTLGALALAAGLYFFDDLKAVLTATEAKTPSTEAKTPSIAAAAPNEERTRTEFGGEVRLRADRLGHFVVQGRVNDRKLTFMADTGASLVALTYEDARRAGLLLRNHDFTARVRTANGIARVAPVTLDRVRVGDITVRNVRAAVAEDGALAINLLGMTFLRRLKSFQVRGDEMILVR